VLRDLVPATVRPTVFSRNSLQEFFYTTLSIEPKFNENPLTVSHFVFLDRSGWNSVQQFIST